MRTTSFAVALFAFAAAATGCSNFDPVDACETRCERQIAMGCTASDTRCDNNCVLADDIYDDGLERAQNTGCVGPYNRYVQCLVDTPPCATAGVIAEMCGDANEDLEDCWN